MAKKNFIKVVSPIGTAAYAWIAKPDEGHQFSDGKYKVTLVVDPNEMDAQAALDKLEASIKEAAIAEWGKMPKNLRSPIKSGDDIADEKEDKDELRGMYLMTAKSKFQPGMVDPQRKELAEDISVRSGDTIRLSAVLIPYIAGGQKGVALQLRMVQLLEQRDGFGGGGGNEFDEAEGYTNNFAPTATHDAKQAEAEGVDEDDPEDF